MTTVSNDVILITGAAAGICRELAGLLADTGARLILADNDTDALERAAEEIGEAVVGSWAIDVTDRGAFQAAYDRLDPTNRPTVLVAGVGGDARQIPFDDLDDAFVTNSVQHNLMSAFISAQICLPHMKILRRGRLVFLASIAGRTYSVFSNAAYVAAKAGVLGLTRQLAYELAPHGVTANAVAHGPVMTERIAASWAARSDVSRADLLGRIPLGRLATPREAAHFVVPFCIGEAGYATGAVLDVNGGLHI